MLPATLTLRDWRSKAPTNLLNRRGQSGDRLALSGYPDLLILCTWPGNFRPDSGAFWQSAAPRMAGNTYRLRAKAARKAGVPDRE